MPFSCHPVLALAACLLATALGTEPIELSILSYNTHGLAAWIARDDPEARFPEISRLLNGYDVALIQEDWEYHELLTEHAVHRVVERGNDGERLLGVLPLFNGSGLTSLVRLEPDAVTQVTREPYGTCSGWLGGANDCLATKGFLLVRLRLAEGIEVDVVQTHLDAGRGDGDRAARARQLALLAQRLTELSDGRPLVVAGDLNLHHDVSADRELLERFMSALGLADSGAKPADAARWRRVDYVLYRSGGDVALELIEAGEALEFAHEGKPLSDHPALFARLRLRPTR